MAKTTDQQTLILIKEVQKQKAEIARVDRPTWRTNCAFVYTEGSSVSTNIQVLSRLDELVKIAAFIQQKEEAYGKAAFTLGVDSPPDFQWNGFGVSDWIEDLKLRIAKIQIATKRKKLETLEERLNKIISPELRARLELEAIQAELS